MSRIRFISAISISVALIGGAMWFRFSQTPPSSSNIIALDELGSPIPNEAFLEDFLSSNTEVVETTNRARPLSQTDIVSRELFSDYITLKSQGQSTSENLNNLASKYAQGIINTEISATKIGISKINIILDSKDNLTNYGNSITAIREKYKNLVIAQYNKNPNITNPEDLALFTFMSAIGDLYQRATDELLALGVPASLAENHLNLINLYLENVELTKIVGNISKDPVPAYSALNNYTQNTNTETVLLSNIQKTLQANGVIFNNNI